MRGEGGQAITEFALVLPVLMLVLLGFAEVAMLVADRQGYQRAADVLAAVAAEKMTEDPGDSWRADWEAVKRDELERAGCDDAEVDLLDGGTDPGDRVAVRVRCSYHWHLTSALDVLLVRVFGESVVPGAPAPPPAPSPAPSAS